MKNPIGWILGYFWMLAVKIHIKRHRNEISHMWMPRWIQPYWMRCMGFEVSDATLAFYRREPK